jgi:ferredoxin
MTELKVTEVSSWGIAVPDNKIDVSSKNSSFILYMLCVYKGSKNLIHIFATIIYSNSQLAMAHRITEDCTACGTCIDECPVEAISPGDIYVINPDE